MKRKATKLEIEVSRIVKRLDDENAYNYPEAVRDLKELFGSEWALKLADGIYDPRNGKVTVRPIEPEQWNKLAKWAKEFRRGE